MDISKDCGPKQNLFVKLHILPILVHMGEQRASIDQSSNIISGGSLSAGQSSCTIMERSSAPVICEEFSLSCEFGHDRYCLSALIIIF